MVDRIIPAIKKLGFGQFEIFHERFDETALSFRANRFYETKRRLRKGFGVRVIEDGKIGFISGTDIDLLTEGLQNLKPGLDTKIQFPAPAEYQMPILCSDTVLNWSEDRLKSFGQQAVNHILEINSNLKLEVEVVRKKVAATICNNCGVNSTYESLISYFWVEGQLVEDNHIFYIYDFVNLSDGKEPDYQKIKDYFGLIIRNIKKEVSINSGSYPALILPLPLSSVLSGVGLGVSGKSLEKGYSPLIGKTGEKVLSDKVTIFDDGLCPFAFNSGPFDGEGVPKNKKLLFEKGVFKDFVFDLETGVRNERESSGNAQRNYASTPYPGVNNLIVEPGNGDFLRTLSSIDEAILVAGVVGGGHGNPYAGDFSVKLDLGFLIRKGEVVGRLTDTMMAGNCYKMLNNVIEIANKSEDLGYERIPWIFISNLTFATPQPDLPPR